MFHWDKKIGHDLDSVILQYCRLKPNCSQISARGWYFPNRAVCEFGVWSEIGSSSVRVTALWRVLLDWRKLKSTDKEAVSPQFDLAFSGGSMQGRYEAPLKSSCSWPKSFGKLEVVKLSPICSISAFSIFHYVSLRTFRWENWGKSRRCAIQDDYASTHCGARAWWCKLQEAEAKIQGPLVLDFFGICFHQFINIQKLHCQSTCQFRILRTIPLFAGCSMES